MNRTPTTRPTPPEAPRTDGSQPAGAVVPVPPGRQWTITSSGGYTVQGYLPGWAEDDPSRTDVPSNAMRNAVYDVIHRASFDGQLVSPARGGYGPGRDTWTLGGNIEVIPDNDGKPSTPVVNVHLIEDFWLTGLGPDEVAALAGQLRAQADRLEHDVRPRLIAYRADWAAHHSGTNHQRDEEQ
jgi:hypothetical protein